MSEPTDFQIKPDRLDIYTAHMAYPVYIDGVPLASLLDAEARATAAERERDEARAIWAEGWLPMDSAPNDAQFLAAIEVSSSIGPTYWQMDVIWIDDETGDIHADCENGWSLSDYDAWMPLPAPPANHSAPVVEE